VSDDKESEREFYEYLRARRARRKVSQKERAKISERMTRYWARRRMRDGVLKVFIKYLHKGLPLDTPIYLDGCHRVFTNYDAFVDQDIVGGRS
jgi:hypothetical protein